MSPLFLMIRIERQVGKMSRKEEYEQKAEALLSPIVESNGFELVDVEYVKEAGNWYLRGYIDKPGGITVNDCETDRKSTRLNSSHPSSSRMPSSA